MILTIEGVDRTGKNTLHKYLEQLGKHKYMITDRGIATQIAYNKKFHRGYEYDIENYKNNVIIYLTAEKTDLEIRCKMTNEPAFDIDGDISLFNETIAELKMKGFIVLHYNTSILTPYTIAQDVLGIVKNLEDDVFAGRIKLWNSTSKTIE